MQGLSPTTGLSLSFLPQVVSDFHMNQSLVLPTLFPVSTYNLEIAALLGCTVCSALACYVPWTRHFWLTTKLFGIFVFVLNQGPILWYCSAFLQMDCENYYTCSQINHSLWPFNESGGGLHGTLESC